MALDSAIRKMWIETQKRFETPVNAIGVKNRPQRSSDNGSLEERGHRPVHEADASIERYE